MQEDNIKNVKSLDYFSKLKKPLPRLKKQRESKKKWKDSWKKSKNNKERKNSINLRDSEKKKKSETLSEVFVDELSLKNWNSIKNIQQVLTIYIQTSLNDIYYLRTKISIIYNFLQSFQLFCLTLYQQLFCYQQQAYPDRNQHLLIYQQLYLYFLYRLEQMQLLLLIMLDF